MGLSAIAFSAASLLLGVARRTSLTSTQTAFVRFLFGLAVVFVIVSLSKRLRRPIGNRFWLVMRGLVGGFAVYLFYFAIEKLGVVRGSLITYTYPVFAALLAWPLLGERVRPRVWAVLCLSLVGVGMVVYRPGALSAGRAGVNDVIYGLVAALGAFCAGFAVCAVKRCRATENSYVIYGSQCLFGVLVMMAVVSFQSFERQGGIIPSGWRLQALLLGVTTMALVGQLLMTYAYKLVPAAEGSLFVLLSPCLSVAGGVLFLGEPFSLRGFVGGALVISSCAFVAFSAPARAASAEEGQG